MSNSSAMQKLFPPEAIEKANATLIALLQNDERLEAAGVVLCVRGIETSKIIVKNVNGLGAIESILKLTEAIVENAENRNGR